VICHTVGFKHAEGYNELPRAVKQALEDQKAGPAAFAAALAKQNKRLAHVGCESCHGPGSAHANNPNDAKVRELINPYRPSEKEKQLAHQMKNPNPVISRPAAQEAELLFKRRMDRLDDFCQKCHDQENDVKWSQVPFLKKWVGERIIHNRPDNVGNAWLTPPATAVKKD
jgi:hypothetical protein